MITDYSEYLIEHQESVYRVKMLGGEGNRLNTPDDQRGPLIGTKCVIWGQGFKCRVRRLGQTGTIFLSQEPCPSHQVSPCSNLGAAAGGRGKRRGTLGSVVQGTSSWSQVFRDLGPRRSATLLCRIHPHQGDVKSLNFSALHHKMWVTAPSPPTPQCGVAFTGANRHSP